MRGRCEIFSIRLPRPFRIAHGTSWTRDTVLAEVETDGWLARGEGALPPYYPSRAEDCLAWTREVDFEAIEWNQTLTEQLAGLPPAPPEAEAARVALEMALHDLHGLRTGQPLWQMWGGKAKLPPCPRTLSIPESEAELKEMLAEASDTRHFKLKAGGGDVHWDENVVRCVRAWRPEARLGVDANGGWTAEEAAALIAHLGKWDVDYAEQPVPREVGLEGWRELRERLKGQNSVALIADESVQSDDDIVRLADWADGVNVKILKAGGLAGARRWIETAKRVNLKVMVGVMVETGIGRTAAAHLGTAADWLDIDPPETIPVAPFCGFSRQGDQLTLSDGNGLGLTPVPR